MQHLAESTAALPVPQLKQHLLTLAAHRRGHKVIFEEIEPEAEHAELCPARRAQLAAVPAWSALHD
jgi:hypothetical protein